MRARAIFLSAALAASVAVSADPFRPGVQDQIKLGEQAAEKVRQEEKILPASDPRVIEVRRIGQQLVAKIPEAERKRNPFKYTFDVIDNKQVNAFALPGGPIFIYTGLLDRLTTKDQVAGILGHELVHIRNQHWASAYADNQKRKLGITALLFLFGAGDTAFDLASVADDLLFTLPYSRRHETESDRVGYDMMVQAGYNPKGMVNVFETLKEASEGSGPDEFLSTHPDTDRRIKSLNDRIARSGRNYPAQRPRSSG